MIEFLPCWIRRSQVTFVKGMNVFDNILVASESLDWAVDSNQSLVMLLLDFQKAYDRVS
jgi:hypothetical protein